MFNIIIRSTNKVTFRNHKRKDKEYIKEAIIYTTKYLLRGNLIGTLEQTIYNYKILTRERKSTFLYL
jgi:hypothetical protein